MVLVTNLPSEMHWRNLKSAFSVAGRIDLCRVRNRMAEISFCTADAAEKAVATYHGGKLNGNRIAVRFFDACRGLVWDHFPGSAEEKSTEEKSTEEKSTEEKSTEAKSTDIDDEDSRESIQRLDSDVETI